MPCGLNSVAIRFREIVEVNIKTAVIVLDEMALMCCQGLRTHNNLVTQLKSHGGFHSLLELPTPLKRITLWISRFLFKVGVVGVK